MKEQKFEKVVEYNEKRFLRIGVGLAIILSIVMSQLSVLAIKNYIYELYEFIILAFLYGVGTTLTIEGLSIKRKVYWRKIK